MNKSAGNDFRTRRLFLSQTATVAASFLFPNRMQAAKSTRYDGIKSSDYVGPIEVLAKVDDDEIFTEGPAVDRTGNVFFTNIPVSKILKWSPVTKRLSVFRERSNETNGLYFDTDGSLICCEGAARRVSRTNMKTGEKQILADQFQGRPLAKPNDLCMNRRGQIFFTSRTDVKDPDGENPKAVYRIDRPGAVKRVLVWPDVHMPNGIVLSPDDSKLYLIEAHPDANHHRNIRVYDVDKDGEISNGRVLIDFYPGRSGDGMCIDSAGNLYVAAGLHKTRKTSETLDTKPGIHVISPDGRLLAFRETPVDTITNCTFGGHDLKSLFVTCGDRLIHMRTKIAGKASYRPQS